MIYLSSRYANAPVEYVLDGRSLTTRPTVMRDPFPIPTPTEVYRWREGDRVDMVGKAFASKAANWWTIMDRNGEIIDPLGFTPGNSVYVR